MLNPTNLPVEVERLLVFLATVQAFTSRYIPGNVSLPVMSAQRLVHLRRLATRVPFDGRYGPTGKGRKEWQGVYALLVIFGLSLGAHYYYVFSPALDGSSKYSTFLLKAFRTTALTDQFNNFRAVYCSLEILLVL